MCHRSESSMQLSRIARGREGCLHGCDQPIRSKTNVMTGFEGRLGGAALVQVDAKILGFSWQKSLGHAASSAKHSLVQVISAIGSHSPEPPGPAQEFFCSAEHSFLFQLHPLEKKTSQLDSV